MIDRMIVAVLLGLLGFAHGLYCPKQKTSPGREVVCYTSVSDIEQLTNAVCRCTTLVHQGYDVRNLSTSDFASFRKSLKEIKPPLQFVISIDDPAMTLNTSGTVRRETAARLLGILKDVDGVELNMTAGTKDRLVDFVKGLKDGLAKKSLDRRVFLVLPTEPENLAKQFDLKGLSKYVDLFTIRTHYLADEDDDYHSFHPSRLMGIFDMFNADSLIDLITGLGAPKRKILVSVPANAYKFTLKNQDSNAPGSETEERQPVIIDRKQLCDSMNNGEWTVERDEDLTAPYAFKNKTWIALEDKISISIKGKYALLRELPGLAIHNIENDFQTDCGKPLTHEIHHSFTDFKRRSRAAVLNALEDDLHQTQLTYSTKVKSSEFRVVRVVDTEGHIRAVRENTQTEFTCSRQGYFVHPKSCNRFYRCVKFNQEVEDYSVFEFDCPAGLAFDERTEVCVWPGSLPQGSPCPGSSEIAPVARVRFECPSTPGYYADPQNPRWFFACMDLGGPEMMAYEFRCPFGLIFDEHKLVCEWPWLVPGYSDGAYASTVYDNRGSTQAGGGYYTGGLGMQGGVYTGTTAGVGYSGSAGVGGHSGQSGHSGFSGAAGVGYTGTTTSGGYSGQSGHSGFSGAAGVGYTGTTASGGYSGQSGFSGAGGYTGSNVGGHGSSFGQGATGYTGTTGSGYAGSKDSHVGTGGYSGTATGGYSGSGKVGADGSYRGTSGTGYTGYSGSKNEHTGSDLEYTGGIGTGQVSVGPGYAGTGTTVHSGTGGIYSGSVGTGSTGSGQSGYSGSAGGVHGGYTGTTGGVHGGYSGSTGGVHGGVTSSTGGVHGGYSGSTGEVQGGYSGSTGGVHGGYSGSTGGVQGGYTGSTGGVHGGVSSSTGGVHGGYSGSTGGVQGGYSESTGGVHGGYSGSTGGVQGGYSGSTGGVHEGYSGSTGGVQGGYTGSTGGVHGGYSGSTGGAQGGYTGSTGGIHGGYSGSTGGVQGGYTGSTGGVHGGYSGSTSGVQGGYSGSTGGVHEGYSGSTGGVQGGYTGSTGGVHGGYSGSTGGAQGGYTGSTGGIHGGYSGSTGGVQGGYSGSTGGVHGGSVETGYTGTTAGGYDGSISGGYAGSTTDVHGGSGTGGYEGTIGGAYAGSTTNVHGGSSTGGYGGSVGAGTGGVTNGGYGGSKGTVHGGSGAGGYEGSIGGQTGGYAGSTSGAHAGTIGGGYAGSTGAHAGTIGGGYAGSTTGAHAGTIGGGYEGSTGGAHAGTIGEGYEGSTIGGHVGVGSVGTTAGGYEGGVQAGGIGTGYSTGGYTTSGIKGGHTGSSSVQFSVPGTQYTGFNLGGSQTGTGQTIIYGTRPQTGVYDSSGTIGAGIEYTGGVQGHTSGTTYVQKPGTPTVNCVTNCVGTVTLPGQIYPGHGGSADVYPGQKGVTTTYFGSTGSQGYDQSVISAGKTTYQGGSGYTGGYYGSGSTSGLNVTFGSQVPSIGTTYHGFGKPSVGYGVTGTPGTIITGNSIPGSVITGDSSPGTVITYGETPGTVISGSVDQGTIVTGGVQPGYVKTSTGTPGYVVSGGVKTVYTGSASPGTAVYGTPAPGTIVEGQPSPGIVLTGQTAPGIVLTGQTAPGVSIHGPVDQGTVVGSTGVHSFADSGYSQGGVTVTPAYGTKFGVSTTPATGYKINEYHDNGGRGTIKFNNGDVTTKYTENDIPDYRPAGGSIPPDTLISGYPTGGSGQPVSTGFTKTGPTKTGITTATLGGRGTYVISTGQTRPTLKPDAIGEKAFDGNIAGFTKSSTESNIYQSTHDVNYVDTSKITLEPKTGYTYPKPSIPFETGVRKPVVSSTEGGILTATTPTPYLNVEVYNSPKLFGSTVSPGLDNTYTGSTEGYYQGKVPSGFTRGPVPTSTPIIYTTGSLDGYKTTLFDAAKIPVVSTTARPVIDTGYQTIVSSTPIPGTVTRNQFDGGIQTGSVSSQTQFDYGRRTFQEGGYVQNGYVSSTTQPSAFGVTSTYTISKPRPFGPAVTVTEQPEVNYVSSTTSGSKYFDTKSSFGQRVTSSGFSDSQRPQTQYLPSDSGIGVTYGKPFPDVTYQHSTPTPQTGGSPTNVEISRNEVDKLVTNYNRGTTKYVPSQYDVYTPGVFGGDASRTQTSSFSSSGVSYGSTPAPFGKTQSSFSGGYTRPTSVVSYQTTAKSTAVGKAKVIVKWSDLHPLLLGKLGAECTCKGDPFSNLRGPGSRLIDSSNGKVDLANYDDSEIYVDLDKDGSYEDGDDYSTYQGPTKIWPLETPAPALNSIGSRIQELPSSTYLPSITASVHAGLRGSIPPSPSTNQEFRANFRSGKSLSNADSTTNSVGKGASFDRYGPGGLRDSEEVLEGATHCARPGLFRHPNFCNKFYACHWDDWKKKFTLHVFNCPVHLTFDNGAAACNWPSMGPACQDDNLLV